MPASPTKARLLDAGALLVLLAGAVASVTAFRRGGVDFLSFRIMADGVARGINVYDALERGTLLREYGLPDPLGMYYPPATGFVLLPLAWLPYGVAKTVWFSSMIAAVVLGIRALVRHAVPGSPARTWMTAVGVVLLSSSIRWGLMLLQGAPLMLGLLCLFVVALHGGHSRWAFAIGILATAFKMTLALPFLGLLLLHRRYYALVSAGLVTVALNVLGFLRMGGAALANYRHEVASLDVLGQHINTPDPWLPVALPRLDWVFLLYGVTRNLPLSRLLALLACMAVSLWLLREGLRTRRPPSLASTTAFLAALVCLGSLCVYHHQYDTCPFFAPLILGYFSQGRATWPRAALMLILPLALLMSVLPIGQMQEWILPVFGAAGVGLLKLSFPVTLTLALVGSLMVVRRLTALERDSPSLLGEAGPPPL